MTPTVPVRIDVYRGQRDFQWTIRGRTYTVSPLYHHTYSFACIVGIWMYLTANNSGTVFVATDWRMAQSREAIDSNINNKIYEGSKNLRILPRVIVGRGEINRPCNLAYTEPLMARQLFNVEYYPVLLLSVVLIGIQWNLYIVHRSMIFFFNISCYWKITLNWQLYYYDLVQIFQRKKIRSDGCITLFYSWNILFASHSRELVINIQGLSALTLFAKSTTLNCRKEKKRIYPLSEVKVWQCVTLVLLVECSRPSTCQNLTFSQDSSMLPVVADFVYIVSSIYFLSFFYA